MNAILSLLLVSLCGMSHGLRLPVVSRSVNVNARSMMMNTSMQGRPGVPMHGYHMKADSQFPENIENEKDVVYATNITLGGQQFPIQLDTGSSDVWVQTPFALDFLNTTDIQANLTFGIGAVSGNISFAEMSLGPYKVPSQAFVNATVATDFGAIFSNNIFGILGLAFDQASTVFVETLINFGKNDTSGRTFLSNVFAQNSSAPNLFTVLLGRSEDPEADEEGIFTISEYDPQFGHINQEPQLFRTPAQLTNLTTLPRWSIQMDKMTVGGKEFKFNTSSVSEAAPGKQVTVLDTGFTFSQISPPAVDFIYQSIPGSVFNNATGLYEVPCNETAELVFEFGGKSFPVHPLDITVVANNGNSTVCNNAFRPLNLPPGAGAGFDQILGVSFLKNAYVSFDFGTFTPNNSTSGLPFVQMVSTTNSTKALEDFNQIRPKQIQEVQSSSNSTGSIELTTPNSFGGTLEFASPLIGKRDRVVIKVFSNVPAVIRVMRHAIPRPVRQCIPRPVRQCVHHIMRTYNPAIVALLGTLVFFSFVSMVVGIVLGVRHWMDMRRNAPLEDGYEVIYGQEEGVQLPTEEEKDL